MKKVCFAYLAVPDAPWNLSVGGVTWESVMLSWQPGFDGGYRQAFTVIYTSPGQPTGRAKVKPYYVNFYNVTGTILLSLCFKFFNDNLTIYSLSDPVVLNLLLLDGLKILK